MSRSHNTASTKKTDEQIQREFEHASAAHAEMKRRHAEEAFEVGRNRLPTDEQFELVQAFLHRFPFGHGVLSIADGNMLRALMHYLAQRPDLNRKRDTLCLSIEPKPTKRATRATRRTKS